MQLQFLESVWYTKKKIFISHSRGFFLLLFKLHNTKNIQREKQGKSWFSRYNKKVEEDEVSCGSFVVLKSSLFLRLFQLPTIMFHLLLLQNKPFRSIAYTIHPSISSMLKFAKNTHIFFFQDASMSFRLMCKNASDISKMQCQNMLLDVSQEFIQCKHSPQAIITKTLIDSHDKILTWRLG